MAYDGSISFDTSVDTSGFSSGTGDINRQFSAIRKGAEAAASGLEQLPDLLDQTASTTSRLADIVKGGGVFKLIEKGVSAVVTSLDSAIDRYDPGNWRYLSGSGCPGTFGCEYYQKALCGPGG